MKLLQCWLAFVASLRVLSVYFGYFKPEMIQEGVFISAKDQVTGVAARAFGIWTLLSCTLTLLCAAHITCKPLYHATLASFAIALLFFSIEFWVYETVSTKTILAPSIIASLSILSMLAGYRENCCGEGKGVAKRA